MKDSLPPILFVDDERNMRLSFEAVMKEEGYEVDCVESAEEALKRLETNKYFMVITDARLGGMSGYDLLHKVKSKWPDLPVLIITAYATPKLAVEAIKAGAYDYLPKPFAPEELLHAIRNCAERYRLLQENAKLRAQTAGQYSLDQLIGECPAMIQLKEMIRTVAPTNATVLILGESGTGKELIAGCLHALSQRAHKPYVRINCAAIPETLLESELFGHEKGAFTGAVRQKKGRVEEANGGTIFLDEIGDMSRPLQAKLLRFLEDGTFTRVGGNQELRVDVRLIAATNRDIIKAIQEGSFREDLFHRLNVVQLRPPPLRERGNDILLLAEHFMRYFAAAMNKRIVGLTDEAKQVLLSHTWPGNVRELKNVMERAVIVATGEWIGPEQLPDFELEARLRESDQIPPSGTRPLKEQLEHMERMIIRRTLRRHPNLESAAHELGLSPEELTERMQRLGLKVPVEKSASA